MARWKDCADGAREIPRSENLSASAHVGAICGSHTAEVPVRCIHGTAELNQREPMTEQIAEQDVIELLESEDSGFIFLTGKAGSGKSSSLRRFIKLTRKKVIVCAPTGVAAINCGGMTIHKMFRLPIKPLDENDIKEISQRQSKAVKLADVMIIDEISMVSAPMLDAVDQILRKCRRRADKPFGGMQIIAVGDVSQLAPVTRDQDWQLYKGKYETPHFFSAPVFKQFPMKVLDLAKIFRQKESEKDFLDILNGVRRGKLTQDLLDKLNSRHRPNFTVQPGYVVLCPKNDMVDSVNRTELAKIPEPETVYYADVTGDFQTKNCLAEEKLVLKPGAQVMFLRNDQGGRYVNGTIGVVKKCEPDNLAVDVDGVTIAVERDLWEEHRYEAVNSDGVDRIEQYVVGSMSQYPVKVAFAVSIHKSQGKTYDKCVVDPRGIFDNGQLYVALSRCTSLSGLILKNQVTRNDIRVDERVLKWADSLKVSGDYHEIHQKFIPQTEQSVVSEDEPKEDDVIGKLRSGQFLSDSEIYGLVGVGKKTFGESWDLVLVLLDEIQMLRGENKKLKQHNASLKAKQTIAEKKESKRVVIFDSNIADMYSTPFGNEDTI